MKNLIETIGSEENPKGGQKLVEKQTKAPILSDEIIAAGGKPHVKALLQRQVNHELSNEALYTSMAIWCENKGFTQTAKFFGRHAFEERRHGMDFINFMAQRGFKIKTPEIEFIPADYEDLEELIEAAVKREYETTAKIQEIQVAAGKIGCPAITITSQYLREQVEEEQLFNSLLALYKLAGENKFDFESAVLDLKDKKTKWKVGALKTE